MYGKLKERKKEKKKKPGLQVGTGLKRNEKS
jgi:hypothetical protein